MPGLFILGRQSKRWRRPMLRLNAFETLLVGSLAETEVTKKPRL